MNKQVFLAIVLMLAIMNVGCANLSKWSYDDPYAETTNAYFVSYDFEEASFVEVASLKSISFNGKRANFAKIYAEALAIEMSDRGLHVKDITPSKKSQFDQLIEEKAVLLSISISQEDIFLKYCLPCRGTTVYGTEQLSFSGSLNSYSTSSRLEGEVRPELSESIPLFLDTVFNKAKECSFADF